MGGMSGAAVFAGPYLIGVVIVDPDRFGEDRLVSAATSQLVTDMGFAELTGANPEALLSVEPKFRLAVTQDLSVLLQPPYQSLPAGLTFTRAPVRLLLPEYGVVPFLGREQPLTELQAWCRGPDRFGLRAVTGDGGAGKTRLAAELATRLMRDGWHTGFSDKDAPDGATRLEPDRSMLLIVDDADLEINLVSGLITTLADHPSMPPSRLLLLARHMGAWWQQLNSSTRYLAGTSPLIPCHCSRANSHWTNSDATTRPPAPRSQPSFSVRRPRFPHRRHRPATSRTPCLCICTRCLRYSATTHRSGQTVRKQVRLTLLAKRC